MNKICIICKQNFISDKLHPYQKTCAQKDCKKELERRRIKTDDRCILCGNRVSRKGFTRCRRCYLQLKHSNKKHRFCLDCNKEINLGNIRCKKCNLKEQSKRLRGTGNPRSGIKLSENLKERIRQSVLKNPRKSIFTDKYLIQNKCSNISGSKKYQSVRKQVLQRDNYTCQLCGKQHILVVHHIKDKNKFWKLFFEIDNLITLCKFCHGYLHAVGKNQNKFQSKLFDVLLKETEK